MDCIVWVHELYLLCYRKINQALCGAVLQILMQGLQQCVSVHNNLSDVLPLILCFLCQKINKDWQYNRQFITRKTGFKSKETRNL